MRCVHYVGFRGDEYVRARRIFGGPIFIHLHYDARVFTEVGDDDIVIFGPNTILSIMSTTFLGGFNRSARLAQLR